MMSSVIYVSRSVHFRGNTSDIDIVNASKINNQRNDITGCLIRGQDWFAQIVEGAHADVTHTFDRIRRDPRHDDITFWWSNERSQRRFPEWRMIFAHADDYGVDLLPMLRDNQVHIHTKQDAMTTIVANHLKTLRLRTDRIDAPPSEPSEVRRPARQRSAP